jgi:hypothetical protein
LKKYDGLGVNEARSGSWQANIISFFLRYLHPE